MPDESNLGHDPKHPIRNSVSVVTNALWLKESLIKLPREATDRRDSVKFLN